MIKLYSYLKSTEVLGPFKRFVIWTQGCPFRCEGCMTPDSRDFGGGVDVKIDDLVDVILESDEIEGVTISGGEPFEQSEALEKVINLIKAKKDLGVIIYTGYRVEELKAKNSKSINSILANTDILIDGLYINSLNDNISLRGSSNQRVHKLSSRYDKVFDEYYNLQKREIEVHLRGKDIMIVGMPKKKDILE